MSITKINSLGVNLTSPTTFSAGTASLPSITTTGDTNTGIFFPAANVPAISTDGTERMRITALGTVLINQTAGSALGGIGPRLQVTTAQDGISVDGLGNGYVGFVTKPSGSHNYSAALFANSTPSTIGSISCTTTATAFNTSSDYRLKENVTYNFDATTRLKQLKPARFNFISEPNKTVDGFLAHEVQSIIPEAITGEKDAVQVWREGEELPEGISVGDNKLDENGNTIPVYQGIDQAKLTPILTKALQEAIAKIEQLEARLTALES
jgi:hypothetical protein